MLYNLKIYFNLGLFCDIKGSEIESDVVLKRTWKTSTKCDIRIGERWVVECRRWNRSRDDSWRRKCVPETDGRTSWTTRIPTSNCPTQLGLRRQHVDRHVERLEHEILRHKQRHSNPRPQIHRSIIRRVHFRRVREVRQNREVQTVDSKSWTRCSKFKSNSKIVQEIIDFIYFIELFLLLLLFNQIVKIIVFFSCNILYFIIAHWRLISFG